MIRTDNTQQETSTSLRGRRLATLALVLVVLAILGRSWLGADLEEIRQSIRAMGPAGALALTGLIGLGTWLWLPGWLLVTLAVTLYGQLGGTVIACAGGLLAMTHSFVVIRSMAGDPQPAAVQGRFLRYALDRLEARPIAWIAVLRAVFWLSPVVSGALALSPVRFRDYLVGSVLGFVPAVAVTAGFVDRLAAFLA